MLHSKTTRIALISLLVVAFIVLAVFVVKSKIKPEWTMEQFVDKFIEARSQFGLTALDQETDSVPTRDDLLAQVVQDGNITGEKTDKLDVRVAQADGPEIEIKFFVFDDSERAKSTFDAVVSLFDTTVLQPKGMKAMISSELNAKIAVFPKTEGSHYVKMILVGNTILSVYSDDSAIADSILASWGY